MRTPIDIRRKRDARKPCKRDHSECCEYVQCIVWTKELAAVPEARPHRRPADTVRRRTMITYSQIAEHAELRRQSRRLLPRNAQTMKDGCRRHYSSVRAGSHPQQELFTKIGIVHASTVVEECRECGFWRARGLRYA